jgi:hypothetical protein
MTGMPAWSDHSDEDPWATVAFIKKLPGMTEQDLAGFLMANIAHGGHHHRDDEVKPGTAVPGSSGAPDHDNTAGIGIDAPHLR